MRKEAIEKWLGRVKNIPFRITQPHKSIIEGSEKIKARFVSTALLLATTIFPILQITSESTQDLPIYSGLTFFLAILFVLSKTEYNRLAGYFGLTIAMSIPYIMLAINSTWNETTALLHTLSWPVLAALFGSQLLKPTQELVLITSNMIGLVVSIQQHPGISLAIAIEGIAISYAIAFLLTFSTWSQEYSIIKLRETNEELGERQSEQEVYTSLLAHDLSNDLQIVMGRAELAQVHYDQDSEVYSCMQSVIAASRRMRSLIQIFRLTEEDIENDIVRLLNNIAIRAEIAFKPMKVTIHHVDSVPEVHVYISRLLPSAFENLLRNCAQHCGPRPEVDIFIKQSKEYVIIDFCDNGPGIEESIVSKLFQKGITTSKEGHGLGLYLTKKVIESHNGTIQLEQTADHSGCTFRIQLPRI
ncbi:MAG: hypothetical protein GF411_06290 [Candidatus Lokiarchaeota archaeon]|nr:hypothetical protein [Candidatus Lokiarchaeota archaeon]